MEFILILTLFKASYIKRKKGLSNCITFEGAILNTKADVAAAASVPFSVIWNKSSHDKSSIMVLLMLIFSMTHPKNRLVL